MKNVKELKYLAQFEYLPDDVIFSWEGVLYVKWNGKAIRYYEPTSH